MIVWKPKNHYNNNNIVYKNNQKNVNDDNNKKVLTEFLKKIIKGTVKEKWKGV